MWQQVLPSRVIDDHCEQFVIAPHHPDRLQRPPVAPGAASSHRLTQALTWNVFRTLELIAPSFWLRRFHVRLTGDAPPVPPQIASVHLWQRLPLPPVQRIDGDRPDLIADVVIETEHAVWTLATSQGTDRADGVGAAAMADAGEWFAGKRRHYCGVIEPAGSATSLGLVLRERYARSHESARLRSATRGPAAAPHVQWGALRWPDLAAVLVDCRDADSLPAIERALARNCLDWLAQAGVRHDGAGVSRRTFSS
jgi:hypothetical protein